MTASQAANYRGLQVTSLAGRQGFSSRARVHGFTPASATATAAAPAPNPGPRGSTTVTGQDDKVRKWGTAERKARYDSATENNGKKKEGFLKRAYRRVKAILRRRAAR